MFFLESAHSVLPSIVIWAWVGVAVAVPTICDTGAAMKRPFCESVLAGGVGAGSVDDDVTRPTWQRLRAPVHGERERVWVADPVWFAQGYAERSPNRVSRAKNSIRIVKNTA